MDTFRTVLPFPATINSEGPKSTRRASWSSSICLMRDKGPSLNSASLTTKPFASSVYVHVPETPSALKRSISVTSLCPSTMTCPVISQSKSIRKAGQVLLDGGRGVLGRQLGQVVFDRGQAQELGVRPGEESHGIAVVCRPRVAIGYGVGEEGEETLGGFLALVGDDGGQGEAAAGCQGSGGGGSGRLGGHCTSGIILSTRFRFRRIMEKAAVGRE